MTTVQDIELAQSMKRRATAVSNQASYLEYSVAQGEHMAALNRLSLLAEEITELAADLAQAAYNEGATKKAIAQVLGVTPATFRGMERQR